MYKLVKPEDFLWYTTDLKKTRPVATLCDEVGGEVQIATDDHCYVFLLKKQEHQVQASLEILRKYPEAHPEAETSGGSQVFCYTALTHVFPELLGVIKKLPHLPSRIDISGP